MTYGSSDEEENLQDEDFQKAIDVGPNTAASQFGNKLTGQIPGENISPSHKNKFKRMHRGYVTKFSPLMNYLTSGKKSLQM